MAVVAVVAVALTLTTALVPAAEAAWESSNEGGRETAVVEGPDPCGWAPKPYGTELAPKLVHLQWRDRRGLPPLQKRLYDKWTSLFPEAEVRLWTDDDMMQLVRNEYAWYLPTYLNFSLNIMRVDAARLVIMHRYGGLYADLDYEPMVNFWNVLPPDRPAVVGSPWLDMELHQNSLMSSPPNHPYWVEAMRLSMERIRARDVLDVAGPRLIDDSKVRFEQTGTKLAVLPCHNFNRFPERFVGAENIYWYKGRMRSSKHTPRELYAKWKDCGDLEDSRCLFGIHHGTSVWWKNEYFGVPRNRVEESIGVK